MHSSLRLLSYEKIYDNFIEIGIEDVICAGTIPNNMISGLGLKKISFINPNAEFDYTYAAIVKNGIVERWFIDEYNSDDTSSAINVFRLFEDYTNIISAWEGSAR